MTWEEGRQKSGYLKNKIFSLSFLGIGFDCYLIKYPKNSAVEKHTDKVDSKKHYRLNYVYKHSDLGGLFILNGRVCRHQSLIFFRPDVDEHAVTKIVEGERKVFSLGICF